MKNIGAWNQKVGHPCVKASGAADSLTKSCIEIKLDGFSADALVDSGSTDIFVQPRVVEKCGLAVQLRKKTLSRAASY